MLRVRNVKTSDEDDYCVGHYSKLYAETVRTYLVWLLFVI